jgi:DNA-binding MarR family transcriptional regulator
MQLHMMSLRDADPAATMMIMNRGQDERLSPCVCNTLRMVARAATQLYDDVLRPSGLRVTQFSILAAIARMGEASVKQLEESLAVDQTTLTRGLALLERDRLIGRTPHPDGRIKAMRLTAKGHRALDVARPLWARGAREGSPGARNESVERCATAAEPRVSCGRRQASAGANAQTRTTVTTECPLTAEQQGVRRSGRRDPVGRISKRHTFVCSASTQESVCAARACWMTRSADFFVGRRAMVAVERVVPVWRCQRGGSSSRGHDANALRHRFGLFRLHTYEGVAVPDPTVSSL